MQLQELQCDPVSTLTQIASSPSPLLQLVSGNEYGSRSSIQELSFGELSLHMMKNGTVLMSYKVMLVTYIPYLISHRTAFDRFDHTPVLWGTLLWPGLENMFRESCYIDI